MSIILPTLNEEQGIAHTIETIPIDALNRQNYDVELIVVDGNSEDKTVEIAKSKGAQVIISERGYGIQYREGFKNANGSLIVTADADGTYPLQELVSYIQLIEEKKVSFISIRRIIEKGAMSFMKRIGNLFLTALTDLLFGLKLKDSQSGMWIFKREVLDKVRLVSNGMPLSEELKIEAFKKVKSIEIDGPYKKRIGKDKLKVLKDGWNNTLFLIKKRIGVM